MGKITTSKSSLTNFGASSNKSNCGCGGGNSLFAGSPTKTIRFSCAKGNPSLIVTEGVNSIATLDLCDWSESYEQFFNTSLFIAADTHDVEINYGHIGSQITFLAVVVEYTRVIQTTSPEKEIPCLTYVFETEPSVERPINNILIHTGTTEKRIPKVFLSNPSTKWNAKVHILASSELLTFDEVRQTTIGDEVITIDNLCFTFLTSNAESLCILDSLQGNPTMFIIWENISNIEQNGKIISIDDMAIGKINLSFKTNYDACQAYSLILWAIKDTQNNQIPNPPSSDDISPVITYNSSFTTEILLTDYPVNGSNGDEGYLITKQSLLDLLVNEVNDNRDGQIFIDSSNVTISPINDTEEIEEIIDLGFYNFIIDVADNACNKTSDAFILNIKDENPPQIILTDFACTLISNNSGTSGTSGSSGTTQIEKIYLEDFANDTITKQNLIDLLINRIWDERDGDITPHINNVVTTITNSGGNMIFNNITQPGNYDIRFQVQDSDNNIGMNFYSDINMPKNVSILTIKILQNQAPVIYFNDISPLYLHTFTDMTITKDYLNNYVIDKVEDDRDGIIVTDILNIQIFQFGQEVFAPGPNIIFVSDIGSTSGGSYFEIILDKELIYITETGLYYMRVRVTDSDGAITTQDKPFTVFN